MFALAACGDDGSGGNGLGGLTVGDVDLTTPEDTAISVALPVKGGTTSSLTVTIATQPQHGTVTSTEGENTTYSYTPDKDYAGTDSFTATVTDGTNTATGTVNITITAVDDAPVAGPAMFTTPLDTALSIDASALLANVTDVDSTTLSIVSVQDAMNGAVALDGTTITFTPVASYFGTTTFTYTASDGQLQSTGVVTVNVGGDNHPPVAVNDAVSTPENTALAISAATLLGNDTDADGNTLLVTAAGNGQHGTAALDTATNTITFTPDAGFHGTAAFDYTISDGNGGSATATVTVTVTPVDQPPVANPDSLTVAQGTSATVNLLANDTDPDGDTLAVTAVTQGANGAVTVAGGVATYTPNPGFAGTDRFTYTLSDGNGGTATGQVDVTVSAVNQPPVANPDAMTVAENSTGTVDVLGNDTDPDGDPLVISGVTNGTNGVVSFSGSVVAYTPNPGFVGKDTFTYSVSDGHGGTATASVTVNVIASDRPPVAVNDLLSVAENASGSVNVVANDTDPDGDTLTVTNFTQPAHGSVAFTGTVATYTPAKDFSGNDAFTYTISDGRGGTANGVVSVAVGHVNQAPVANADTLVTRENTVGTVIVTSNDTDVDNDTLQVTTFTQPAHGVVTFSNNVASYTPPENFTGNDTFTYTISDGHGASATANVAISVIPGTVIDHPPVATNDVLTAQENAPGSLDVAANDSDPDGDPLSVSNFAQPAHGTVTFAGNVATYTPATNFHGADSFTYTISDGRGATANATVAVNVAHVNQAPVANADTLGLPENTTATLDVSANDSDVDGDALAVTAFTQPANGSVTFTNNVASYTPAVNFVGTDSFSYTISDGHGATATTTVAVTVANGTFIDHPPVTADDTITVDENVAGSVNVVANDSDPDGDTLNVAGFAQPAHGSVTFAGNVATYTPANDFHGNDAFTYTVSDGRGDTTTGSVTVTVLHVNQAPVANNDTLGLPENTIGTLDVSANDSDPDGDALQVTTFTQPAHGSVTFSNNVASYTPPVNFTGVDSFTYTISDGNITATATVAVTVSTGTFVDHPPVAVDDALDVSENASGTIDVATNDTDPDGDSLNVAGFAQPAHGTVSFAGNVATYTPANDFHGNDAFTYTVSDGQGGTATGTVQVAVAHVNQAPVANNDTLGLSENTTATIDVSANDTDPDGDTLTVVTFTQPVTGSVTFTNNVASYTPPVNFTGTDSFSYTITDGHITSTATVSITVSNGTFVDHPPVANNDTLNTSENAAGTVNVLTNDTDPDSDPLAIASFTQPSNGSVTFAGGVATYTPATNFHGNDAFTYTISDGHGDTATGTVSIVVGHVNQNPVANADTLGLAENTTGTVDVAANDSDVDGDALQVTAFTQPANGSVTFSNTVATYTPPENFTGTDSFTYTIDDGHGGTATATVSITVSSGTVIDHPPVAVNDTLNTSENAPNSLNVVTNDTDPDSDALNVASFTQPSSGSVTFAGNVATYTPAHDFHGNDAFTYTVSDGRGGTSTGTVSVVVGHVNQAPVATNDTLGLSENTTGSIDVAANDSDVDGDTLQVTTFTQPSHGSVTFTNNVATYTPPVNFTGADSFSYTISDGHGGTATATVAVTVSTGTFVDHAPVANNDLLSTSENAPNSLNVVTNDTDPDGDTLTVANFTQPTHGAVTFAGNVATYTPASNFHGNDAFTYTISDGNGDSATGTVSVTVGHVNQAPVANADTLGLSENTVGTLDVSANDSDVDGDTLQVTAFTQPAHGSVTFTNNVASYTPPVNFTGTDSFTYTISDGNLTSTATVSVTVNPGTFVDHPPVATNDLLSTLENQAGSLNVVANDTDPDSDPLNVSGFTQPGHGAVSFTGNVATYTPANDFHGNDAFTYTISDGHGDSATGTVSVTVGHVNQPPVANNDTLGAAENTTGSVDVAANDSDVDGDALQVTAFTQPAQGTVTFSNTVATYTPPENFTGTDSFTYTISDGNGGTATATVAITVSSGTVIDHPPVATNDLLNTSENVAGTLNVATNDTDPDGDTLNVASFTQPSHGGVSFVGNVATYTPDNDFHGNDAFTYVISDGRGGNATGTVSIVVGHVNQNPVANADTLGLPENTTATLDVAANDTDVDGDTLSVTAFTQPANGGVSFTNNVATYTPPVNFTGTDSFTYTISDGHGGTATTTVGITVTTGTFVDHPPTAGDDTLDVSENSSGTVDVLANDSDPDGDPLTVQSFAQGTNGSVSFTGGVATYTPNPNFHGADSFTYTIADGHGDTATGTVSVTVGHVNQAPIANADTLGLQENTVGTLDVTANDSDVDGDALVVTTFTQPANGTVTFTNNVASYTPPENFTGADSFTYTISDGNGGTATATVAITVANGTVIDHPPVATNDLLSTSENTAGSLNVATNDTDPDSDPLNVASFAQPSHGSVTFVGNVATYTPDHDFHGNDAFTYVISDGRGDSATGTVSIVVGHVNQPPVANDDTLGLSENTTGTVDVGTNDTDVDGDPLQVTAFTQPTNGSVTFSNNVATYTPPVNFVGTDSFTYTISDGNGGTATATVAITVRSGTFIDHPPTANNDLLTTAENTAGTLDVVTNDTDIDGDVLTVTNFGQPANGTVTFTGNVATYTPAADFHGNDSFTYTIDDGHGDTATGTVSVTVTHVNQPPVANDDTLGMSENTSATVDVATNDTDVDGDALQVISFTPAANGAVSFTNTVATYTPNANFIGADSFTYTISDGNGGTSTATVAVTVASGNHPPIAIAQALSVHDASSPGIDVLAGDSDPDAGDSISLQAFEQGANGTTSASGSIVSYDPGSSFFENGGNGTDAFAYTIVDTHGATASANVTVTIHNAAPTTSTITASAHDAPITIPDVLANASDADGDSLTITPITAGEGGPHNGTVVYSGTSATYTPNTNFAGFDSFEYTIADGHGGSTIGEVVISETDQAPTASDQTIQEQPSPTIAGVGGQTPGATESGTTATFTTTAPHDLAAGAQVVIAGVGVAGYNGTFTISSVPTANSFTVDGLPTGLAPSGGGHVIVPFTIATGASDPDGDPITFTFSDGAHGTVTPGSTAGTAIYVPNAPDGFDANNNSRDSFTYTVTDSDGLQTTATVTLIGPCGNGQLDKGEDCDDGNNVGGDGCEAACTATCGDFTRFSDSRIPTHIAPDGVTVDRTTGSCFAFYQNGLLNGGAESYADAQADCRRIGGHLPTITQFSEEIVAGAAYTNGLGNYNNNSFFAQPWIGANDITGGGDQWITGEPFQLSEFDFGQPSGGACTFLDSGGFGWAAADCNNTNGQVQGLLCEVDLYKKQDKYLQNASGGEGAPAGVVTADFNDDGFPDVAFMDQEFDRIVVMLGDGLGGFHPLGPIAVPFEPVAFAVGELDGDHHPDLAVVGNGTSLEVYLNDKHGGFVDQGDFGSLFNGDGQTQISDNPVGVAIVDLDGDGNNEVAVANVGEFGTPSLGVLLNGGGASFSTLPQNVPLDGTPSGIASGPVGRRGALGFAVAMPVFGGEGGVDVVVANQNDTFFAQFLFDDESTPDTLTIGDIDGDGISDLAVGRGDTFDIGVYAGIENEGGVFENFEHDFEMDSVTNAITFDPQTGSLLLADTNNRTVTYTGFDGSEGGSLQDGLQLTRAGRSGIPNFVTSLAVADFDGDNVNDVMTASEDTAAMTLLSGNNFGYGPASYTATGNFPPENSFPDAPTGIATGDFDGDGFADIAVTNAGDGTVGVLTRFDSGTFDARGLVTIGGTPSQIAAADMNGDGALDLVVSGTDGTLSVLLGDGTGNFTPAASVPVSGTPGSLVVADFDGDGNQDVAVTLPGFGVDVLLGQGDGELGLESFFGTGAGAPAGIAVGNIDANNGPSAALPDLVVGDSGGVVSALVNQSTPGNVQFSGAIGLFQQSSAPFVGLGDFDGDGVLDLVALDINNEQLVLEFGDGFGDFGASGTGVQTQSLFAGIAPRSAALADLDRDGYLDVVVADENGNTAEVFLNQGIGVFQGPFGLQTGTPGVLDSALPFAVGATTTAAAVADFSGDGKPDIAVTENAADGIEILTSPR